MTDPIDRDIRAYFAVKVGHPPVGARGRILAALPSELPARRKRPIVRWAAAALALVVVFGGIGAVTLARRSHSAVPVRSAQPSPLPTTTVTPTVLPQAGPIPANEQVILYRKTDTPTGDLFAASWNGLRYSGPNAPVIAHDMQSPDGARVLFGPVVYSVRSGTMSRLPEPDAASTGTSTGTWWADDSQHLCTVSQNSSSGGGPGDVALMLPGQPTISLARVGSSGAAGSQYPPAVLACSYLNDRVVIGQTGALGEMRDLWVIRVSTRTIEYHKSYPAVTKSNADGFLVTVSRDGEFVAETNTSTAETVIRHLPDGDQRARFSGQQVIGFSWTGKFVITTMRPAGLAPDNIAFGELQVMDWGQGRVTWSASVGLRFFGQFLAQPNGDALALALNVCPSSQEPSANGRAPSQPALQRQPPCADDLWIVDASGKARLVDRDVHLLA